MGIKFWQAEKSKRKASRRSSLKVVHFFGSCDRIRSPDSGSSLTTIERQLSIIFSLFYGSNAFFSYYLNRRPRWAGSAGFYRYSIPAALKKCSLNLKPRRGDMLVAKEKVTLPLFLLVLQA
jgi:hypothetical protein